MTYLGIDEQQPALPFIRLFSPTDIQETAWKMAKIIADRHSWDWINPTMWRIVGLESGNVIDFLRRYILVARTWQTPLTPDTAPQFKQYFIQQYDYRADDLEELFNAFFQVRDAGMMPDTIFAPWGYVPSTVAEDIGEAVTKNIWPKLLILSVLGLAAYGFATKGAPAIFGKTITQ